jgi:hypothetical protein
VDGLHWRHSFNTELLRLRHAIEGCERLRELVDAGVEEKDEEDDHEIEHV